MKKTTKTLALVCALLLMTSSCKNNDECKLHIEKLESLCKDYVELSHKLRESPNDLKLISQYENLWKQIAALKELPQACKDDREFVMKAFQIARAADSLAIGAVELDRLAKEEVVKKEVKQFEDKAASEAKQAERDLQVYDSIQKANKN